AAKRGRALLARGDLAGAVEAFARALRLDPGPARARELATAYCARAAARARDGELEAAWTDLRAAKELAPRDPRVRFRFASHALLTKRFADARAAFDELLADSAAALSPEDRRTARFRRARALRKLGDARGALADLDALLGERPREPNWLRLRAKVRLRLGDAEGARRDAEEAVAAAPEAPEGHFVVGQVLLQRGRPRDALAAFDRGLALSPAPDPALLTARAAARQALGDVEEALADVEEALRREPSARSAQLLRVQLLLGAGRVVEALRAARALREQFPQDPEAHAFCALAHQALGDLDEALRSARKALRLDPEHGNALVTCAGIEAERGRFREAATLYERALGSPDRIARERRWLEAKLRDLLDLWAEREGARAPLRFLWGRAEAHLAAGELVRAEEVCSLGLSLAPRDPLCLLLRARARRRRGDFEGALADLEEVLAQQPANTHALLERARLRVAQGKLDAARKDAERVLRLLSPEDENHSRAEELLDRIAGGAARR
ncbi:MAG: tetratricopeptide repeat protein, partial [Planctomycetota bacterium]